MQLTPYQVGRIRNTPFFLKGEFKIFASDFLFSWVYIGRAFSGVTLRVAPLKLLSLYISRNLKNPDCQTFKLTFLFGQFWSLGRILCHCLICWDFRFRELLCEQLRSNFKIGFLKEFSKKFTPELSTLPCKVCSNPCLIQYLPLI